MPGRAGLQWVEQEEGRVPLSWALDTGLPQYPTPSRTVIAAVQAP